APSSSRTACCPGPGPRPPRPAAWKARSWSACNGCGPRTLLAIAALVGAYYFLLPELAKVSNPLPALESAQWAWVLVAIAFSALTYLASAIGLLGGVSVRVPFWPTVLTQGASSFVNLVSPSNVGGMALHTRFLQNTGDD